MRLIRIAPALAALSLGCSSLNAADPFGGAGSGGGGGGAGGGGAGGSDGLPCAVRAVLQERCQGCHGAMPMNGAPMSLVTRADLMATAIADPSKTFAQVAVLRMQSGTAPMPPPPNPGASASDVMAMAGWIAAGYPEATCDGNPPPDGGLPPDGGPPPGCEPGATYCDDFEMLGGPVANGQQLGPWTASVGGTGVVMQVDGARPHSGAKSLHITVPAGTGTHATLRQTVGGGLVAGNNLFGRAMVYYSNSDGNDLPLGVHSWIFNASGMSTAAGGNVSMNLGGGGAKLQLNYHPPAPLTEQSVRNGMITAGQWHCIQWQYDGSGTPPDDIAKVWIDGTLAVDVGAAKGWDLATPWTAFAFGFTHYQTTTNPVDVYLDDFALGGSMIACP